MEEAVVYCLCYEEVSAFLRYKFYVRETVTEAMLSRQRSYGLV